jgi:hypothetical protein
LGGSDLPKLEPHDEVGGQVSDPLGVVGDGGRAGEGEDVGNGSGDQLERMVFVTGCNDKK